ncbi:hypothetical protein C2U70_12390 [Bradyrhizobium guangdongense]|uniref:hypothetical protein n=1 Tax=Bradyrhizobium guangdongense TaxID=1325090 RepID=UPI00112675DA|nr:hypothetical protein [Bradyrhizobium guangdongense]TPQ36598.1 hypothetical protein C2U70_12390 [Bradyrhizobium guangdongense]
MSIKTKIAAAALAALTVTASVATTSTAQAKPLNNLGLAIGATIATAAVVGAVAATNPYPYGYYRCGWVAQYDAFGHYMGRVRTCY